MRSLLVVLVWLASALAPAYVAWVGWQWLGPESWLFGSGFMWWLVKVVMTVFLFGTATRLLYLVAMLGVAAVGALFRPKEK